MPSALTLQGLDSEHPILKLDDLLFQGTWEESVGTVLLFKENTSQENTAQCASKTSKKLRFMKIRVEKREEVPQAQAPVDKPPAKPT